MTEHLCTDRPGYQKGADDPWVEGRLEECPHHGPRVSKQLGYREGRKDRAKKDKAAGVVGIDRGYSTDIKNPGGYIHGV